MDNFHPPKNFGTEYSVPLISIKDIQQDPFCLDGINLKTLRKHPSAIICNSEFSVPIVDDISLQYIAPPALSILRRICPRIPLLGSIPDWIASLNVAVRLALAIRRRNVIALVNLGSRSGTLFCFFNSFRWCKGSGKVIVYRALLYRSGRIKTAFIRRLLQNVNLIAVWSRRQIENYHQVFKVPREKFVFLPYKANHSQSASFPMPIGDYIFSGGNSERDYKTLFKAVEGLSIPVIVSTTEPSKTIYGLTIPDNVILINAPEPAFQRLMAGSRMLVLCLKSDMIRGAGEATILNAMWHGKPVLVADNVSACDYIKNGIDGFVVPAGDSEKLRRRILELWSNHTLSMQMGEEARNKAANHYTHNQFKIRIQAIAMVMYAQK